MLQPILCNDTSLSGTLLRRLTAAVHSLEILLRFACEICTMSLATVPQTVSLV